MKRSSFEQCGNFCWVKLEIECLLQIALGIRIRFIILGYDAALWMVIYRPWEKRGNR
jgi:hypothetical protein